MTGATMDTDRVGITVNRLSDLRLLDMARERIADDLGADPDDIANIEAFRWLALEYLDEADRQDTGGLRVELNGTTPVLLAALRATGAADTAEAFEAVARDYLTRHVDLPDDDDCGHLEEYQTADGCLRCWDEAHRNEDRKLVADLVDDPGVAT